MKRRIGLLGFDGVQALDVIGPADAFASDVFAPPADAAASAQRGGVPHRPYEIVIIGLQRRRFTASSGVGMNADVVVPTDIKLDTLIVPGGYGLRIPGAAERAAQWIASRAPHIRRVASVCTGIYGIAPTGLLDGRRVTTHWAAVRDVRRRFPKLQVDSNAVFLKDGRFYTSAGITAGIDLALALIEEDWGPSVALSVAREMVVYFKRAGGQDQFSEPLQFQVEAADRFADLVAWIHAHLDGDLSVAALSKRAFMSVRHFSRAFNERLDATPAAFVERVRMAEASRRLAARRVSIEAVARSVGFASEDVFRRAFERHFHVSPRDYRKRFSHLKESA
jgi:transcriptional regulator GlxA family with amidase domain